MSSRHAWARDRKRRRHIRRKPGTRIVSPQVAAKRMPGFFLMYYGMNRAKDKNNHVYLKQK